MRGKMFRESFVFLYFILFLGKGLQFIGQAWLNYLAYSVLFILGILAYQKELLEQIQVILPRKKVFFKTLSLYMVLLFLLTLVFNFLVMWLKSSLGLSLQGQNNANIQKSLAESPFLVLIFGCFIGPFVEELFFRRFLLGTFFAPTSQLCCSYYNYFVIRHPSYAQFFSCRVGNSHFLHRCWFGLFPAVFK